MNSQNHFKEAAERGDAPLLPNERIWGFLEFTYANSALADSDMGFSYSFSAAIHSLSYC